MYPITRAVRSADPAFEPVSVEEAKKQIELPSALTAHDVYLGDLIAMAREQVEHDTGIIAATGTFTKSLDEWPPCDDYIPLAERPVTSITSITYTDTAGSSQTWASGNYSLDTARNVIMRAYNVSWPETRATPNAITITFVAGYASQNTVLKRFRQAVLLRVHSEFTDRNGCDMQPAYDKLINSMLRYSYP